MKVLSAQRTVMVSPPLFQSDIYFVTRHAIEVCERAFNGLAVDICPVHGSYFQLERKKARPLVHSLSGRLVLSAQFMKP